VVDLVIGNSSSGIVEVPFMGIPTVNIGERQKGRIMNESIINVPVKPQHIVSGIKKALSKKRNSGKIKNPYGNGTAAMQMIQVIRKNINNISTKKKFYDINVLQ
jgi:GDP/UDP-N,N'-diacetylbacillosamine 2-epimerase (hydrolysing)